MEKTTIHENVESNAGFEQAVREIEEARVRIEETKIASRERVALADIASFERMQYVKLDGLLRFARHAFECFYGRFRPSAVGCAGCAGVHPMPAPVDSRATTMGRVPDVAPDSAT